MQRRDDGRETNLLLGYHDKFAGWPGMYTGFASLPETDRTRLLIGRSELAAMRPDAVLINLSRGGIVDEAALSEALGAGALRGAALDVFQAEPLPPDSPLREHGNVLFTPHAGSISPRYWDRQGALMRRNFANWRAGVPLENQVDKERGY